METKGARIILLLIAFILVVSFLIPIINQEENRESVLQESLQCLSAVCTSNQGIGESCEMLSPQLSRVSVEIDDTDFSRKVLKVTPVSGTSCR